VYGHDVKWWVISNGVVEVGSMLRARPPGRMWLKGKE